MTYGKTLSTTQTGNNPAHFGNDSIPQRSKIPQAASLTGTGITSIRSSSVGGW